MQERVTCWMPLVIADRIGIVEALVEDISRCYVPNVFKEAGWKAQWKYDRSAVIKKVVVMAVVTTAIILLCKRKQLRR